jgi:hypothetical protein
MKGFIAIFLVTIIFSLSITSVFARSGCCSHHQGVCGCGCCDGTSLSSTCAPYYPECSSGSSSNSNYVAPVYNPPTNTPVLPTGTPYPTSTPTPRPILTPKINIKHIVKSKPKPKINVVKPKIQKHWWDFFFGR